MMVNASRKQFGLFPVFACNRFEPLSKSESWDSAAHGFRIICFITSANAADYQHVPCLETAEASLFRDSFENTGARDRGKTSIHWIAALGHMMTRDLNLRIACRFFTDLGLKKMVEFSRIWSN